MNWNAKDTNEVSLNKIWHEHVDKEKAYCVPKTKYTANPCSSIEMNNGLGSRMPSVTDKVGYRVGLDPVTLPDDKDVQDVVAGLLGQQKIPQEKYEAPQTSAQDVGWFYEPLVQPNPKFQHGLRQGDATKFAENYTQKMAGAHLFHGKSGKYLKF